MERSKPYRGARWGRLGRLALGVLLAMALALGVGVVAPQKNAVAAEADPCPPIAILAFRGSGDKNIEGATTLDGSDHKYAHGVKSNGWEGPVLSHVFMRYANRTSDTWPEGFSLDKVPIKGVGYDGKTGYPAIAASFDPVNWKKILPRLVDSSNQGARYAEEIISGYRQKGCNTKFIAVGHSQGAMAARTLAQDDSKDIVGVVDFGDPLQKPNAEGNQGAGADGQGLVRYFMVSAQGIQQADSYYDLDMPKASLCHAGDPFCDYNSVPSTGINCIGSAVSTGNCAFTEQHTNYGIDYDNGRDNDLPFIQQMADMVADSWADASAKPVTPTKPTTPTKPVTCTPNASTIAQCFPDPNLAKAVAQAANHDVGQPLTKHDIASITGLGGGSISNLQGIENLTSLTRLGLAGNQVSNIAPLSKLTNLTLLDLGGNRVSDVGPLANLTNLTELWLDNNSGSGENNRVSDVGPLANLTNLTELDLGGNRVSDVGPLSKLTKLTALWLEGNQITDVSPLSKLTKLTEYDGLLELGGQSVSLPAVASSSVSVPTSKSVDGSFVQPDRLTPSSGSYDAKTSTVSWKGLSGSGSAVLHAIVTGIIGYGFDVTITQPYTPPKPPVVKYAVSFDAQGGSAAASQSVVKGGKATKPANPTRGGYTFAGWSSDKAGSKPYDFNAAVSANLTLYAQWKAASKPTPAYTVSFDANGGRFANGSSTQKVSVKQGAKYALAAAPSRSGYTFSGWFTAKTGGSVVTGSPTATGSRTLYAQWKAVPPVKVTTSFSAVSSSSVAVNSATVSATLKDSAGKPVAGAGVTFATADGKTSASVKTSASGVAKATLSGLKASTKYSVTAKYAGDATHSASTLGTPISFATKAAAKPKPVPSVTVSFDANGGKFANGSASQQVSAKQGAKYALAKAPSRPGYSFAGWFTAKSGGSKVTGSPVATGSRTLYAQWKAVPPAKLATAFSAAGPSNVTANSASVSATLKDSAGKPVAGAGVVFATTDGKVSVSVSAKTDASGVAKATLTGLRASTKYSVSAKYAGDATHSASALGSPIAFTTKVAPKPAPIYTMSFDANGGKFANGSAMQQVSAKQGARYALAAAPVRSGYTFSGWFTAKSGGSKVTGTPTATGSRTLYAQWAKNAPVPKPAPKPAVPQPVYRLYNPNSGLHHYTTSAQERDALVKLGWKSEGASFNAAKQGSAAGLVPVYREYNPHNGNHNWTANKKEHDQLVSLGWKDEGIAWYVPAAGPVKVLRLYNPNSGEHVYTTSAKEYAAVGKAGWHQEGLAWTAL
jgi:uncharacterized repeat protein (TIGR02543 family)